MHDIIKSEKRSETENQEMGVLDQYAEMCRYQNKRHEKTVENLADEDTAANGEENENKEQKLKKEDTQNEQIKEMGQVVLDSNSRKHKVELLTIIGEVEGHESAPSHSKTTKYEHVLPKLAIIEDDEEIEGLLILLNTVGGSRSCYCRDDCISEHPYGVTGSGRRAFYRCSYGCFCGLFFCSAKCDNGDPSGTLQRNVYWSCPDLSEYGKNSGSYHRLYCGTFQSFAGTTGRTDAGYQSAGQRCRNASGR